MSGLKLNYAIKLLLPPLKLLFTGICLPVADITQEVMNQDMNRYGDRYGDR